MKKYLVKAAVFCAVIIGWNCNKSDSFSSAQITDYIQLAPGKYIIYRLDSAVKKPFDDTGRTVRSYQAKDIVDAAITDNLGRPGWRMIRYLNDTAASGPWVLNIVYSIIPTREGMELVENNLRFIKLRLPIKNDFTWKGNSYINTQNNDQTWPYNFLDAWDYTYQEVDQPFVVKNTTIENTITVQQRDEILGFPDNPDSYSEKNFAFEVYAKGVGLVYKTFSHWSFQPRTNVFINGYADGYGITLTMIAHN